jgi:hypothetical protein
MEKSQLLRSLEKVADITAKSSYNNGAEHTLTNIENLLRLDLKNGGGGEVYAGTIGLNPNKDGQEPSHNQKLARTILGDIPPSQAVGLNFAVVVGQDSKSAQTMQYLRLDLYPAGAQNSEMFYGEHKNENCGALEASLEAASIKAVPIQEALNQLIESQFERANILQLNQKTFTNEDFQKTIDKRNKEISESKRLLLPLASKSLSDKINDPSAPWNKPAPYTLDKGKPMRTDAKKSPEPLSMGM